MGLHTPLTDDQTPPLHTAVREPDVSRLPLLQFVRQVPLSAVAAPQEKGTALAGVAGLPKQAASVVATPCSVQCLLIAASG